MENNNKLIAEFMGIEEAYNPNGNDWVLKKTTPDVNGDTNIVESHKGNELQYHNSWDWLMPVVEKIDRYQFDMGYTQCNIYDHVKDCVVASGDMGSKLLSTHKAVVEFIKDYNKYPFNEGDDYYTIDDDEVIWSCWDDESEEVHDDNPNKQYFRTKKEAENYNQNN